jgi:GT2 family glycosyltransferase
MALIAMCCHDTEENGRTDLTKKTLQSIAKTVDLRKHRLAIIDNNSCAETKEYLERFREEVQWDVCHVIRPKIITLPENIGTARAINLAWQQRKPGEHCIKMDNDVVIHYDGWVDEMEAAIANDPLIGQVGLKRKDCWEFPGHEHSDFKSELIMLPHTAGDKWRIVEKVKHVIGTCVMHSSALLDRVGYLYQPSLYGYDDVIMSHRCHLAGMYSCFLSHININHIDPGATEYQSWKEKHSGEQTQIVIDLVHRMIRGEQSIYFDA